MFLKRSIDPQRLVEWKLRRVPGGWEGMVVLPMGGLSVPSRYGQMMHRSPKPMRIKAASKSPAGALAQASGLAQQIMSNPLIRSALPPGSDIALEAVNYLSKNAAAGKLAAAAGNVIGKGAKRLKDALSSIF